MSLKINYLDKKKPSNKNKAIFVHQNIKISEFKGDFEDRINQKILNLIKQNKNLKENKIFSINEDFNSKIIVIFLLRSNTELEFEKLGASFYDFLKKNDVDDIYIKLPEYKSSRNENLNYFSFFIHGLKLKSYEFNLYKSKKIIKLLIFIFISQILL